MFSGNISISPMMIADVPCRKFAQESIKMEHWGHNVTNVSFQWTRFYLKTAHFSLASAQMRLRANSNDIALNLISVAFFTNIVRRKRLVNFDGNKKWRRCNFHRKLVSERAANSCHRMSTQTNAKHSDIRLLHELQLFGSGIDGWFYIRIPPMTERQLGTLASYPLDSISLLCEY